MRIAVGLIGLLIALAVVGLLSKRLLQTHAPAPLPAPAGSAPATGETVKQQSLNTQQQFKQAVEGALATPRPEPPAQ